MTFPLPGYVCGRVVSCDRNVPKERYSRVWGSATVGIDAVSVCIETYLASGLPKHTVVGLPRGAVRESLDRIWAALRSSGYSVPRGILTVNLAPADVAKEGTAYDLPVAIGIVAADGQEELPDDLGGWMILGELTLNGGVRPVRGVLSSALQARRDGISRFIVPRQNEREAASVDGLEVFGVSTLLETFDVLRGNGEPYSRDEEAAGGRPLDEFLDMADVVGQTSAKLAMTIAAAGGHNLLMIGPPGCGKTMLALRFPGLLPPLSADEAMETTAVHSLRGYAGRTGLIRTRPFRSPHHSITRAGMTGGGTPTLPGEASLAHNGVLFLDELPEFSRPVLESLREPLEAGEIVISRAAGPVTYPARFQLLASMNPCPCGYYTSSDRSCTCSTGSRLRYASRLSGPLLDRIDMTCTLSRIPLDMLESGESGRSTSEMRESVMQARRMQVRRNAAGLDTGRLNAFVSSGFLDRHGRFDEQAIATLNRHVIRKRLSMRARDRLLRISRTITDMDGEHAVSEKHVATALQFRPSVRPTGHGS